MHLVVIFMCLLVGLVTGKTYIDHLEGCNKDVLGPLTNVRSYRSNGDTEARYAADLQVKRRVNIKNAKLTAEVQKCTTTNITSCKPFPRVNLQNTCSLKHIPQLPLKDFFECMNPRPDCVFEPQTYKLRNCLLDLSRFTLFSLQGYFWHMKILVFGRNDKYICLKAMVHVD